jgi:N-acetylmuramoyl-L-alanine amidase
MVLSKVKKIWILLSLFLVWGVLSIAADTVPRLEIEYPPFPALQFRPNYIPRTNLDVITVRGKTEPLCLVWVQGKEVEVLEDGSFKTEVSLVEGSNIIVVKAQRPEAADSITIHREIILDTSIPQLDILEPANDSYLTSNEVKVVGKTGPRNRLIVNGLPVILAEDGSFEVFVPLKEGENFIYLAALDEILPNINDNVLKLTVDTITPQLEILAPDPEEFAKDTYVTVIGRTEPFAKVILPEQEIETEADSLGIFEVEVKLKEGRNYIDFEIVDKAGNMCSDVVRIVKDTKPPEIREFQPAGTIAFMPGDVLDISFTSNEQKCTGSFTIGSKGPFPISEQGAARYRGIYRIQPNDVAEGVSIQVTLTDEAGNTTERNMAYLTVYDPSQPMVAELYPIDGAAVIRSGPSEDYDRICHIGKGPRVEITGRVGDWYRISPAKTFSAWTHRNNLRFLPRGAAPGRANVTNVVVNETPPDYTTISFTLSDAVFYTVTPLVNEPALILTLYNSTSGVYHIAWKSNTDYVKLITPIQVTDDIIQYRIDLKGKNLYGYKDEMAGNTLNLRLKSRFTPSLEGKTITIDPGHGPDSGAVGPTGLREADVNLRTGLLLKSKLEAAGVTVYMTRDEYNYYAPGLYDRVALAEKNRTDMYVSIHNNAASNRSAEGSEAYYYTPYSHDLSRLVIKYMNEHQGSDYRFFAHRSFAVIRQWTMPAILTEGDYISNYKIEEWQRTDDFIEKNAEAIFMAIKEYVETYGWED